MKHTNINKTNRVVQRLVHAISACALGATALAGAAQAPSGTDSDVAILIQAGHTGKPSKVIAYHGEDTSLLETWDGTDVRLWRRSAAQQPWQLFRHWKNLQRAWSHSPNDQLSHFSSYVDGHFELYRADNYQLAYRTAADLKPGWIPQVHVTEDTGQRVHIVELDEVDAQGKRFTSLHISTADGRFEPWHPLGRGQRILSFIQLSNNIFAIRPADAGWRIIRVGMDRQAQPVQLPGLSVAIPKLRKLGENLLAAGIYEPTLRSKSDKGTTWHIFWINPQGKIVSQAARHPNGEFQPGAIKQIESWSKGGFIRLSRRTGGDADAGAQVNHFYRLDPERGLMPLHEFARYLPREVNDLKGLAEGLAFGIEELDDADENGQPGDWHWAVQDSQKVWRDPRQALPGLTSSDRIWTMTDWLEGEGLGIRVVNADASYASHWYLRDSQSGDWLPAKEILPLPADLSIDTIRDRRDGLIEVVAAPDTQAKPDEDSPVPYATRLIHWMMRAQDGRWTAVRQLVAEHRPGLENKIIAVDARSNGLMVDIRRNREEAPIRLLFYKNRDAKWTMLENSFHALAGRSRDTQRPFPQVQSSEVLANGKLVLLREQKDANGDGVSQDTQLLQAGADGWQLLHIDSALGKGDVRLSFDRVRDLLIREGQGLDGRKHFFHLDDEGNWTDVRSMVPDAPSILETAFRFAGGQGLAIQEAHDANGNDRFSEWFFYYQDGQNWRDLRESLPGAFPAILTLIDAGGRSAISVQEDGDANGNGRAGEWRHYYRQGSDWVDLQQQWQDLPPRLSEVRISDDGRILTAVEEWDANGNGRSFERITGVWSDNRQTFVPLARQLGQPDMPITQAVSLWDGAGLAVQLSDTGRHGTDIRQGEHWQLYQRLQGDDAWQRLKAGHDDLAEVRGDRLGRLLAVRRVDTQQWEVWFRSPSDGSMQRWRELAGQPLHDVRPGISAGVFAVKLKDQWQDGAEQWALWRLDASQPVRIGQSATPIWFGHDNLAVGPGRIRFEDAGHYLDGRPVESVPQPAIWFHNTKGLAAQDGAVYAPALIAQALTGPEGQNARARIKAVGYGPSGTVILYQSGPRHFAAAFTNGSTWLESRPLLSGSASEAGDIALLVNRLPDGSERLFRLDAPDRWLWSYRHEKGRIYYDERGYFFNETDAVSELLSFRVDLQVHSFAQLGSYLFRPDLLEKRLGLPEHSLFELTQHDVERIQVAQRLAPEGVDIASLKPPHIEAVASVSEVTEPYIDLQLSAEGFGIDESSVMVRILGAGQARSALPRPSGDERQRIRFTRRVPLVPGLNRLEVTIYDANGLSHSQRLAVTFKPKVERKPTLYAAVVATADYKATNSLAGLPLTQNDAKTIYSALAEQDGKHFEKVEVHTWCQNRSCQSAPTRQNLLRELPAFLAGAQNGDYILIYVSGHGLKIGSEYFMVPEDGDPNLPSTLVAWSEIQNWLRGSSLGKKMVMLDTCQSGAVFQRQRDQRRMVQQAAEQDGIYVLSAAAADASAYELSNIGNGVFTYVINEGLVGQADLGSDGSVSFEELSFHVARRVRELSSAQQVRMEPYVPIIDQQMDFTLARVDRQQQLFLRISDISTFDSTALPGRSQWWQQQIEALDAGIALSKLPAGSFRLVVIEDQGKPLRGQLTSASGQVLGQWRFSETTVDHMLQATKASLTEQQQMATACGASRGLDLAPACQ